MNKQRIPLPVAGPIIVVGFLILGMITLNLFGVFMANLIVWIQQWTG